MPDSPDLPRLGDHVARLRDLLALERDHELAEARRFREEMSREEAQAAGVALVRLAILGEDTGPGGRVLWFLGKSGEPELPPHRMHAGDVVTIGSRDPGAEEARAVITRVRPTRLEVAVEWEPEEDLEGSLDVHKVADDRTWKCLLAALDELEKGREGRAHRVIALAFAGGLPDRVHPVAPDFLDEGLDPTQREAVSHALGTSDAALVHGPPGTGKTRTLAEIVRQEAGRGGRVLVAAPTNVAVDNLLSRLVDAGEDVLRIGHPARMHAELVPHGFDERLRQEERASGVALQILRDIEAKRRELRKERDRETRRTLGRELGALRKELRTQEAAAARAVVGGARIIGATTTGCGDRRLAREKFDLVVLDEAAQALEPAAWLALLRGDRAVLGGDHHQLPPVVQAPQAAAGGLSVTLFDRLARAHGEGLTRRLGIQYRMHRIIQDWSSSTFYEGALEAAPAVAGHRLPDLPGVAADEASDPVFLWIDTAGRDFEESDEGTGTSRSNEGEADLVRRHVAALVAAGVPPEDIAVISPYLAQVRRVRELLHPDWPELEIDTVDGFQGREKEAVVITTVRSNPKGEVGFLSDPRRMNVAVTRARRQVTVIGDSATLARDRFLEGLHDYAEHHGTWRSAWEYAD